MVMSTFQTSVPSTSSHATGNSWIKRYPIMSMLVLMFVLAWPLLISEATDSYGLTQLNLPQWLGLLTGWAPGIAAFAITALVSGKLGVRALLHKTFRWRVGVQWYVVAL